MVATILRTSSSKRDEVGSVTSTVGSTVIVGGGDDNSVTNKSTMTGNSTSSRSDNDANGGGKRSKSVQFPLETDDVAKVVCEIPNREEFTTEDIETLWFSKNDYSLNRQECQMISRDAIRYGYAKYLEDVFNEKNTDSIHKLQQWVISSSISPSVNCTSPMSAAPVTGTTASTTTSADASATLTEAAATTPANTEISRRGLERWSNRDHGEVRKTEQFKAVMAVLEAQDEMLGSPTGKIDIDKLRKVSYKATKVARHFARMMGKVDSFAVLHLDDDPQTILFQHQHQLQQQADLNKAATANGKSCDGTTTTAGPTSSTDSIVTFDTAEFNEDDSLLSVVSRVDEVELVSSKKTISPFSRFRFSSRRKLHNKNKVPGPTASK